MLSRIRVVEGVMSQQIQRVVGLIATITLFVLSVEVAILNAAEADDCVTAPKSPAPQGTRWYYHLDRTNQRKCWYVRAPGQPAQQVAAQTTSEGAPDAQSHSMAGSLGPVPATAVSSAPMSINPNDSSASFPHVGILALKPKRAAAAKSGSEQEGRPEPQVPKATAPKTSTSLQTSAQLVGPTPGAPAEWPDVLPTVATVVAEPATVLAEAGTRSVDPKTATKVPDQAESAGRGGNQTVAASLTAAPMVLTLALGLVAAGVTSRAVMKIAAARRAVMMTNRREADWADGQWQPEGRGQEHEFIDESYESDAITPATTNCEPLHPARFGDEWVEHAVGEGHSFEINEISKREDTLSQLSRDLHTAVFGGSCGRRNMTARA
jgi:hypothetical protein